MAKYQSPGECWGWKTHQASIIWWVLNSQQFFYQKQKWFLNVFSKVAAFCVLHHRSNGYF
jgi:hypothetical protein